MLRIDPIPPGEREAHKTVREPNIIQYSPCWTAKVAYEKTFAISHSITTPPRIATTICSAPSAPYTRPVIATKSAPPA